MIGVCRSDTEPSHETTVESPGPGSDFVGKVSAAQRVMAFIPRPT